MKKFVKGLLVSGFAVALLAGCSNKSKSGDCPVCPPVPEPETKEAWTDFELSVFGSLDLSEIPFAHEMSISEVSEDNILFATSKNEVSEEEVEEYADSLLDSGKYFEYDAGTRDGHSVDVGLLGFDADSEIYEFYRPYKDKETSLYADVLTIGLDKDGHMLAAEVSSYLPYYALLGPDASNGMGISYLQRTVQGQVLDFYNLVFGGIIASTTGGDFTQTIPTTRAAHPEIVTDATLGSFFNYGVVAPYVYGNPESSNFNASYDLTFFKAEGEQVLSYTQDEFEAVLDEALDLMRLEAPEPELDYDYGIDEETGEVWFFYSDLAGFTIEVSYLFEEVQLTSGPVNAITMNFEPHEFGAHIGKREIASILGESVNYKAKYLEDGEYSISFGLLGPASEYEKLQDAFDEIDEGLVSSGLVSSLDVGGWRQNPSTGRIYENLPDIDGSDLMVSSQVVFGAQSVGGVTYYAYQVVCSETSKGDVAQQYYNYAGTAAYQAYSNGLIDAATENSLYGAAKLIQLVETVVEVKEVYNQIKEVLIEKMGFESVYALVDRLMEDDFQDEGEETTRQEAWEAIQEAYETSAEDLTNDYWFVVYGAEDLVALKDAIEAGVAPIRTEYMGLVPVILESAGIKEANYDATDWAAIQDEISAFNLNDCYNSVECQDKIIAFVKGILAEYQTWDVKYSSLFEAFVSTLVEADYTETNWEAVQGYVTAGRAALEAATTAGEAESAYLDNRAAIEDIPTKLDTYKETKLAALAEVFGTYDETKYSADNWIVLTTAYSNGQTAIQNSSSEAAVDSAYDAAVAAMADVLPEAYKTTKVNELQAAYDAKTSGGKQYSEEDQAAMDKILADAKEAVNKGSSKAAVDSLVATAIEQINAFIEVK